MADFCGVIAHALYSLPSRGLKAQTRHPAEIRHWQAFLENLPEKP